MPRRKILRMHAGELPIFLDLVKMLHKHPVLKDSDFTTLELVAKKKALNRKLPIFHRHLGIILPTWFSHLQGKDVQT